MDKHRGKQPRGLWVRQVLWRELVRLGEDVEEHVSERRGGKGSPGPRLAWKRKQHEREQEQRAWKAEQARHRYQERGGAKGVRMRKVLKRYEGISWLFRDDGGVVASDVEAGDAGHVDAEGRWHQASRHGARVIAWAVGRAMEMDRERAWGERWRLLVEREGRPTSPVDVGETEAPGVAARRALARKRKQQRREKELRELGEP